MSSRPGVRVEAAFGLGFDLNQVLDGPGWTNLTTYLEADQEIALSTGRANERSSADANHLGLSLTNADGRFSPGNVSSPYYPDVTKGTPIRVRMEWPLAQADNLVANPSFEVDLAGWESDPQGGVYTPALTTIRSTAQHQSGAASMLVTWPGSGSASWVDVPVFVVIGRTYTASLYVYVPSGSPDVALAVRPPVTTTATTATKNAWTRLSVTFTATAATVRFGPRVTSPAGGTCYVDAVMLDDGPTLNAYTAAAPAVVDRFTGYVDEWPVTWPNGYAGYSTSSISATSELARLSSRSGTLRTLVQQEAEADNPVAFWPMGEDEGTLAFGNTAIDSTFPVLSVLQRGSGGTLTAAVNTGPPTDDLNAPQFGPIDGANGLYLQAANFDRIDDITAPNSTIAMSCFFNTNGRAWDMTLMQLVETGRAGVLGVRMLANDGHLVLTVGTDLGNDVTDSASITSTNVYNDGLNHFLMLQLTVVSSGTLAISGQIDGNVLGGSALGGGLVLPAVSPAILTSGVSNIVTVSGRLEGGVTTLPNFDRFNVGGPATSTLARLYAGTLSNVSLYATPTPISTPRWSEHWHAGSDGFTGETASARIARLARYGGTPFTNLDLASGVGVDRQDTTDASALDLMRTVEVTEDGFLFDDYSGRLSFQARSERYAAASVLTLDAATEEVGGSLEAVLDDQTLLNDLTGTRRLGADARVVDTASRDQFGTYSETIDTLCLTDGATLDAVNWRVFRYSVPRPYITQAETELVSQPLSADVTAALAVQPGDAITLTNLPPQAPQQSGTYFVEGLNETITIDAHRLGFMLSTVESRSVWALDSTAYSILDVTTKVAY